MIPWQSVILFLAAGAAGVVNSLAGGGTLLSYPALIWAGRDPIIANATSTVALWPGSFAGTLGYRGDIGGKRRWIILLGIPSVIGGAVGAVLLLRTPSPTFAALVPWLIFGATVLRAAQEPISRWLPHAPGSQPSRAWWTGAIAFQFLVAVYGGYFGAGIGILMLAALGLLGLTDIHQMNGLKTLFAVCINGVASAYFIWSGKVNWPDALLMAAGAIAGGYGGAHLARKLGRRFVNRTVIVIGLAMTVLLLLKRR